MWSSIKSILKDSKTKCIIIEEGEPKYVILPFEEYQHLQKGESKSIVRETPEEHINGELSEKSRVAREEATDRYASPITLEDLPF